MRNLTDNNGNVLNIIVPVLNVPRFPEQPAHEVRVTAQEASLSLGTIVFAPRFAGGECIGWSPAVITYLGCDLSPIMGWQPTVRVTFGDGMDVRVLAHNVAACVYVSLDNVRPMPGAGRVIREETVAEFRADVLSRLR